MQRAVGMEIDGKDADGEDDGDAGDEDDDGDGDGDEMRCLNRTSCENVTLEREMAKKKVSHSAAQRSAEADAAPKTK